MPNELIWILFLLFELCAVVVLVRAFGRQGLYALVVANVILCNIQVQKEIRMIGLTFTLGNVLYGSIFLATDLLGELYGKREAKRAVWLGFAAMIVTLIAMMFANAFMSAGDKGSPGAEVASNAIETLFGTFKGLLAWDLSETNFARITIASLVAYLLSQLHDVWAFHFWRSKTKGRHLWFRNNASTWVSQLLDSAVFCTLAFLGAKPTPIFFEIMLTTYFIKLAVAALDTPFAYLGRRLGRRRLGRRRLDPP